MEARAGMTVEETTGIGCASPVYSIIPFSL